jgi:HD-GYP domain-containing protein (c-di-GMP phosphodiesterase class II)
MAALGAVIVPFVIQDGGANNGTDPVYSTIYLAGAALIPWVAGRLAKGRLVEVRRHLEAVQHAEHEAVQMLARAAEAKDDVTGGHVLRVGEIAALLAAACGLEAADTHEIRYAAMLHDVGKLHVPDRILMKPGPLDAEEWEVVRRHTVWGERILGGSSAFEVARHVARWHHENWDGSGYPDGLAAGATPLAARIVHLSDVFDALRTERPYKPAWPLNRVLEELRAEAGRMFDPDLVAELVRLAGAQLIPPAPPTIDGPTLVAGSAVRRLAPDVAAAVRPSATAAALLVRRP